MPYLCLAGNHIRSYADERFWKILEIKRILITDSQGTDKIVYILSIDISRRKTSEEIVLEKSHAVRTVSSDMEVIMKLAHHSIPHVMLHLGFEVILLVKERDGKHVFLFVLHILV